jgi:predicted lipoprotein with Yx(FWY)xxD motif
METTSDAPIHPALSPTAPMSARARRRRSRSWRLSVGTLAFAALVAAGCGSSSKTASTAAGGAYGNGGSTTTTAAASTTAGAPAASAAAVSVATNATLGAPVLVGPNGHTLYLFEKDTGTTTACTGGCASAWPALKADGTPTGGTGVTAAKLSVANGQVVYNGHLLYYFAGDTAAGDAKGVGIPSWFPVGADGNKIAAG